MAGGDVRGRPHRVRGVDLHLVELGDDVADRQAGDGRGPACGDGLDLRALRQLLQRAERADVQRGRAQRRHHHLPGLQDLLHVVLDVGGVQGVPVPAGRSRHGDADDLAAYVDHRPASCAGADDGVGLQRVGEQDRAVRRGRVRHRGRPVQGADDAASDGAALQWTCQRHEHLAGNDGRRVAECKRRQAADLVDLHHRDRRVAVVVDQARVVQLRVARDQHSHGGGAGEDADARHDVAIARDQVA